MREAGIQPSAVSYGSVMNACARAGDPKEAENWLDYMDDVRQAPNVIMYTSAVDACRGVAGGAAIAERFFRRMLNQRIMPDMFFMKRLSRILGKDRVLALNAECEFTVEGKDVKTKLDLHRNLRRPSKPEGLS